MKRIVIALSLLLAIICTAIVNSFVVENAIDKINKSLEVCVQKEENETLDSLKIKDVLATWNHNKKFLFAIMFHDDFSDIESSITKLEYLSKFPDYDESVRISIETSMMLDKLKDEIAVTLENVF